MVVALPMSGFGNYGSPGSDLKSLGLEGGSDPWSMPPSQPGGIRNMINRVQYQASGAVPPNQAPGTGGNNIPWWQPAIPRPPAGPQPMFPDPWTAQNAAQSYAPGSGLGGSAGTAGANPDYSGLGGAIAGEGTALQGADPTGTPNMDNTALGDQWRAQQDVYGAQRRAIGADRARLLAQPRLSAAEGDVLSAQEGQLKASSAYLSEQTRAL